MSDNIGKFKIEINFDDLVNDMFNDADIDNEEFGSSCRPSVSFKESLKNEVIRNIAATIITSIKRECMIESETKVREKANEFIESELQVILLQKLKSGDIHTKYDGLKNFDELIEKKINSINIDAVISKHINNKSDEFAKEMKSRYDNIFAARIVHSLKEQKMLAPDVAKILLG